MGQTHHLTDAQRQCLRLVLEYKTSKEIAVVLGISPHTVDMHIKEAMRRLNASTRIEAALAMAGKEGKPPQPLVPQPSVIAIPSDTAEPSSPEPQPRIVRRAAFPWVGEEHEHIGTARILVYILGIATASILVLSGLLSTMDAISRHFAR